MIMRGICATCKFGNCFEDEVACSNKKVMWQQSGQDQERYKSSVRDGHINLIRVEVISDGTATCEFWESQRKESGAY